MRVLFSRRFDKDYKKALPAAQTAFQERLKLFVYNPFNPSLNNHALKGVYLGKRSINITGDWRALYEEKEGAAYFVTFGTHSQLYG